MVQMIEAFMAVLKLEEEASASSSRHSLCGPLQTWGGARLTLRKGFGPRNEGRELVPAVQGFRQLLVATGPYPTEKRGRPQGPPLQRGYYEIQAGAHHSGVLLVFV